MWWIDPAAFGALFLQFAWPRYSVVNAAAVGLVLEAAVDPQVLRRRRTRHGLDRTHDHGGIRDRIMGREIGEGRRQVQVVAAVVAALVRERKHGGEIGRASCRERVCQYG